MSLQLWVEGINTGMRLGTVELPSGLSKPRQTKLLSVQFALIQPEKGRVQKWEDIQIDWESPTALDYFLTLPPNVNASLWGDPDFTALLKKLFGVTALDFKSFVGPGGIVNNTLVTEGKPFYVEDQLFFSAVKT